MCAEPDRLCVDSGTAPRGAHARAWAARAPWALGRVVLPRGHFLVLNVLPPLHPWLVCRALIVVSWPLLAGLEQSPVAHFQPGTPVHWPAAWPRGVGSRLWAWLCTSEVAPPLSCKSWGWGGGDGSLGLSSSLWTGGGMGRHMAVALSQCRWVWEAGGDVAGGVEISACGFPNILPACHRTACQDPGCQAQPGPPPRGAWLLVCSPTAAQGAGRGHDVRAGDIIPGPRNPCDPPI